MKIFKGRKMLLEAMERLSKEEKVQSERMIALYRELSLPYRIAVIILGIIICCFKLA